MVIDIEKQCDLLIIGGGFGGLWAAIYAADNGVKNIIIVDKGYIGKTSMSKFSAGALFCFLPEDNKNFDKFKEEMKKSAEGFGELSFFNSFVKESYDRLKDLEKFKIDFEKDPKGNYLRLRSRGTKYAQFLIRPKLRGTNLIGGQAIVNALLNQTKKRNIEIYNKIFITDLLKSKNNSRIGGAIGFNRINGEFHIFQSKAVVLAASNNSFRGNYVCTQATTGSSYKLAYEIGAVLRNMEFLFINTGSPNFGFEGTGPICQMGAKFKNKDNEAFMAKYDLRLKDKTDSGIISKAMALEVKNGRGPPLYLDFSKVENNLQIMCNFIGGWMPLNIKKLKKLDSVHFSQQQEWVPTIQNMLGGIHTNFDCESTVPGLFAAGDCHSVGGLGGFNGMASAHCAWSGTHAGIGAAKYIRNADNIILDYNQIKLLKKSLYEPLDRDQGKTPEEILLKMQAIIFPYDVMIIRHKERLENALRKISELRQDIMFADDFHNLTKLKEVENMLLCAELFLKASLMREESRKDYYREDFPNVDNKNWLKWILIKKNKETNQPDFYTKPIIWENTSINK